MVDFLFPESRENLPTNFNKIIPLTNRDKWRTKHYTCRAVSEAINLCNTNTHTHAHTHTHQFYDPFSSTIQVSQCQKKSSSGFYGAREDKQRQTHRPSSWAPLHPDQSAPTGCWLVWMEWRPAGPPTSIIPPPFCARYPSCRNPPTLSWLGTGTKYAGLHTQWRCETLNMCQFNFNNEWWSNASKQPARCPISQTVCMLDNALAYLVQPFEQVARLS